MIATHFQFTDFDYDRYSEAFIKCLLADESWLRSYYHCLNIFDLADDFTNGYDPYLAQDMFAYYIQDIRAGKIFQRDFDLKDD